MDSSQWEALMGQYKAYMKLERGLSDNSIESYARDVRMLGSYLEETFSIYPPQADAQHVEQFLSWLYDRSMSRTSQARILSGVRAFYNFMVYTDRMDDIPTEFIEAPKTVRRLPDVLAVEQIDTILLAIDLSQPQGHRNRAMLEMLYSCGLRVSELVGLRLSDLFFDDGFVRVTGKGGKQRLVPLSDTAARLVKLYLQQRVHMEPKSTSKDIVFLNRLGTKLSRIMVFNIIKDAVAAAGIDKNVSPHTFRHSFATHLLEGGASIRQIQDMLGHESILTTEIYTHLDRSHLRRTLETHHPLNE